MSDWNKIVSVRYTCNIEPNLVLYAKEDGRLFVYGKGKPELDAPHELFGFGSGVFKTGPKATEVMSNVEDPWLSFHVTDGETYILLEPAGCPEWLATHPDVCDKIITITKLKRALERGGLVNTEIVHHSSKKVDGKHQFTNVTPICFFIEKRGRKKAKEQDTPKIKRESMGATMKSSIMKLRNNGNFNIGWRVRSSQHSGSRRAVVVGSAVQTLQLGE